MYETRCKLCGKRMVVKYKYEVRKFCCEEHYHMWLNLPRREKTATCEREDQPTFRDMSYDGFITLVAAIVDRASTDVLLYNSGTQHRETAERFFRSDYFGLLTGLDGKPILQALLAERRERMRKKHKGGKAYDC